MNHTLLKMEDLIPSQLFSIFSNLIRICNRDGPTRVDEHAEAYIGELAGNVSTLESSSAHAMRNQVDAGMK